MFYTVTRTEQLVIPPQDINTNIKTNITQQLKAKIEGQVSPKYGFTIAITKIDDVSSNGIIDVNDGSVHFKVTFECLILAPKKNDVLPGTVIGVTDRNLLIVSCGPLQCLVHQDQILQNSYVFNAHTSQYIHEHGTSPPITQGSTVWVQIISDKINVGSTIIGSIIRVCESSLESDGTMGY